MSKNTYISIFALLLIFTTGCSSENDDLEAWMSQIKNQEPAPLDALPSLKSPKIVSYTSSGDRNPFTIELPKIEAGSTVSPNPERIKEPLEAFTLPSLKLVGWIENKGAGKESLIKDPNGIVHRVRVGQHLGQQEGRVVSMSETEVVLMELHSNSVGGWEEREVKIVLDGI